MKNIQLIVLITSLTMIGVGCTMAFAPLGLIVPGALLFAGLWASRTFTGKEK